MGAAPGAYRARLHGVTNAKAVAEATNVLSPDLEKPDRPRC